jgi:nucleotide-binding universal stress UspA family protein
VFEKIVWATDGSEAAEGALQYAKALAREQNCPLVVTHSAEVVAPSRALGVPMYEEEAELEEALPRLVADLKREGIDASLKIVESVAVQPANTISDVAREVGADLIVVGTRGHTALGGLLLGSVTERLLHLAPCPVLVIPAAHTPAPEMETASQAAGVPR